jgi:curved DNA-binding protein CbpA
MEVDPQATSEEIKKKWKELAKKYHPDKAADNPELTEEYTWKMAQINAAYDVLSDEGKRKEFDKKRNQYKTTNNGK